MAPRVHDARDVNQSNDGSLQRHSRLKLGSFRAASQREAEHAKRRLTEQVMRCCPNRTTGRRKHLQNRQPGPGVFKPDLGNDQRLQKLCWFDSSIRGALANFSIEASLESSRLTLNAFKRFLSLAPSAGHGRELSLFPTRAHRH